MNQSKKQGNDCVAYNDFDKETNPSPTPNQTPNPNPNPNPNQ